MWKARLFLATAAIAFGIPAAASAQVAGPAAAQDNPLANRTQDPPPALRFLTGQGVKLTYLGEEGGLRGYLGESPNGKMQTFYLTPDGNHVIAGVAFKTGGVNVTGLQIGEMQKRFEGAKRQVGGNMTDGAADAAPAVPAAAAPQDAPKAAEPAKEAPKAEAPKTDAAKPVTPVPSVKPQASSFDPAKAEAKPASAAEYLSGFDKARFLSAVNDVAWFSVGAPDAPVLYMVADPQCPFCHAAWKDTLRKLVVDRKLAVNVILINGLQGSEPLAISLLARSEPGKAWFSGEGSENGVAIAPPPAAGSKEYKDAKTFLEINNRFAKDYKVTGTPFFAYVGKDGKLYSAAGPRDLAAFLSAL